MPQERSPAGEKVRLVLKVFQGEVRVSELCRWEGIRRAPGGPGEIRTHGSRIVNQDVVAAGTLWAVARSLKAGPDTSACQLFRYR